MLTAGRRRCRIRVERHNGKLEAGEVTYHRDEDWESLMEDLPAAYQQVSGGEVIRGRQMKAHTTGLIQILSTPRTRQIDATMRIVLAGRKLDIVSVLDLDGTQQDLSIQVSDPLLQPSDA